jgi:hypothetical protein
MTGSGELLQGAALSYLNNLVAAGFQQSLEEERVMLAF